MFDMFSEKVASFKTFITVWASVFNNTLMCECNMFLQVPQIRQELLTFVARKLGVIVQIFCLSHDQLTKMFCPSQRLKTFWTKMKLAIHYCFCRTIIIITYCKTMDIEADKINVDLTMTNMLGTMNQYTPGGWKTILMNAPKIPKSKFCLMWQYLIIISFTKFHCVALIRFHKTDKIPHLFWDVAHCSFKEFQHPPYILNVKEFWLR